MNLFKCSRCSHLFNQDRAACQSTEQGVALACPNCSSPLIARVPAPVVSAISRKFADDPVLLATIFRALRYDSLNDCYGFTFAGMFHGVEPDGYIHT